MNIRSAPRLAAVIAGVLALAACGGSDDDTADSTVAPVATTAVDGSMPATTAALMAGVAMLPPEVTSWSATGIGRGHLPIMAAFARQMGPHANAMQAARDGGWFSEELYARFQVLGTDGAWGGADPLAPALDLAAQGRRNAA